MGGVGDVVRDLPRAMSAAGLRVTVATPSYGTLHKLPGASQLTTIDVDFRGKSHAVDTWQFPLDGGVSNVVFDHALFAKQGPGRIYHRDEDARPFASDADKFAFYCAVAAKWISAGEQLPDVVHLHDWHTAFYLLLTHYAEPYKHLCGIRTVFTIHNLSYQGIRPFDGDASSVQAWYPGLPVNRGEVADPVYDDCVNPMATAIRLADRVSTVSPTYAGEICRPSDAATGFIGGERLENDLIRAREEGRLHGVLNGCYYDQPVDRRPGWQSMLGMIETQLEQWQEKQPSSAAHALALERIRQLPKRRPTHVVTSIGRLVAQKATLLLQEVGDGETALQRIAADLDNKGVILLLGSGDPDLEERMLEQAQRIPNLIFLHGYSETLAETFYNGGDLFLMPSSFEPCGISQMLAMRGGQPCVVHGVGGLKDTVEDGITGFVFDGHSTLEQAQRFVTTTARALQLRSQDPIGWQQVCREAAARRFDWASSAKQTVELLYNDNND